MQPVKWTVPAIRKEALKFQSRTEFARKSAGAYAGANLRGILDSVCEHMTNSRKREPGVLDTFCLWEAVGELRNNNKVYKLGFVAQQIGGKAVVEKPRKTGVELRMISSRYLGSRGVPELEKYLLTFGEDHGVEVLAGRTGFRSLSQADVTTILRIIESHPLP